MINICVSACWPLPSFLITTESAVKWHITNNLSLPLLLHTQIGYPFCFPLKESGASLLHDYLIITYQHCFPSSRTSVILITLLCVCVFVCVFVCVCYQWNRKTWSLKASVLLLYCYSYHSKIASICFRENTLDYHFKIQLWLTVI